jgi:hypothetical protein
LRRDGAERATAPGLLTPEPSPTCTASAPISLYVITAPRIPRGPASAAHGWTPPDARDHFCCRLTLPGAHDVTAFKNSPIEEIVNNSGGGIGDKGYIGSGMVTPVRKPRHGELSIGIKHTTGTSPHCEAPVEQFIAYFKSWRILHTGCRRPYETYVDSYDAARGLYFLSVTWGFE